MSAGGVVRGGVESVDRARWSEEGVSDSQRSPLWRCGVLDDGSVLPGSSVAIIEGGRACRSDRSAQVGCEGRSVLAIRVPRPPCRCDRGSDRRYAGRWRSGGTSPRDRGLARENSRVWVRGSPRRDADRHDHH
jgi:hypothetical protein